MNVANAFLHGDLFEEVYMSLSLGYSGVGSRTTPTSNPTPPERQSTEKVCRLHKSLHGLKQAPRQWFSKLSTALLDFGFQQSKADYSLFLKKTRGIYLAVLVYVDDMLVVGDNQADIATLK